MPTSNVLASTFSLTYSTKYHVALFLNFCFALLFDWKKNYVIRSNGKLQTIAYRVEHVKFIPRIFLAIDINIRNTRMILNVLGTRTRSDNNIIIMCGSWNELFCNCAHANFNLPCKSLCKQNVCFIRFNEMHRLCSNNFARLMNTDFIRFPYSTHHTPHSSETNVFSF